MAYQNISEKLLDAKLVIVGSQGKTSIIIRHVGGMFSRSISPTVGASFFTHKQTWDGYRINFQVWDTAGQERFRALTSMYFRRSNVALLVYDVTDRDTFYAMQYWVKELQNHVKTPLVKCLLGNKCDLDASRRVSTEEAKEYAASIDASFYETSVVKNVGIEAAFNRVSADLVRLHEANILLLDETVPCLTPQLADPSGRSSRGNVVLNPNTELPSSSQSQQHNACGC